MPTLRTISRFTPFLLLTLCVSVARCQTTADGVNARLKDKVVFFRGLWAEDDLHFDGQGVPVTPYNQRPFTESGFQMKSVKLDGGKLIIEGQRMAVLFDKNEAMSLAALRGKSRKLKYDGHVRIELRGTTGEDFGPALDAVFTSDIAALKVPEEWQHYVSTRLRSGGLTPVAADQNAPPKSRSAEGRDPSRIAMQAGLPEEARESPEYADATQSARRDPNLMHIAGSVKAPVALRQPEPEFSNTARMLKHSGNVRLYLWVDENGLPSHIAVAKPAGAGLDEEAIAAVKRYVFSPALRGTKPVKVDLFIDVNFQIF